MASEAAVLGIPAIFISDTLRGYTIEEEKKYNLVYNLSRRDIVKALDIINDICQNPQSGKKYKERRAKLLKEKINVTEYVYSEITSFTMRNA